MRRVVIGGLLAAVLLAFSTACARAIKSVVVTPGGGTTKVAVNTMPLVFHDPFTPGGCKLLEKPARFTVHYGEIVVWHITNTCDHRIDVCVVGFLRDDDTVPDPLEDVDNQNNTIVKRRCDRIKAGDVGEVRTRVRAGVKPGGYEYTILRRRRDRDWKIVDPMIDIVP
jgi:hypothetical protein